MLIANKNKGLKSKLNLLEYFKNKKPHKARNKPMWFRI